MSSCSFGSTSQLVETSQRKCACSCCRSWQLWQESWFDQATQSFHMFARYTARLYCKGWEKEKEYERVWKSNVKGKRHVDCHSSVTTGTTKRMKAEHAKHQPHSHAGILTSDYAETNFILAKQPLGLAECSASTAGRSPSSSHPVGFVIHSICFGLIWCPQRHAWSCMLAFWIHEVQGVPGRNQHS